MGHKNKVITMGRGIFYLLAVGTLPVLFMNPLQYVAGLFMCGMISFGLAFVLV